MSTNDKENKYNQNIQNMLHSSVSASVFTGFAGKTVKISRLCYPEAIFTEEKYNDPITKQVASRKVLSQPIGLNIIVKADNGASIFITVPCTDELFNKVISENLWVKFDAKFKLKFDNTGKAVDIMLDGTKDVMDYADMLDAVDINDTSENKFMLKNDPNISQKVAENILTNKFIFKSQDKKHSLFASDANVQSDTIDKIIVSLDKIAAKRKIKSMDVIEDPKAVVSEVRDNYVYVTLV